MCICQSDSLCFCSEVAGPSSFNCAFLVCLTLHVHVYMCTCAINGYSMPEYATAQCHDVSVHVILLPDQVSHRPPTSSSSKLVRVHLYILIHVHTCTCTLYCVYSLHHIRTYTCTYMM